MGFRGLKQLSFAAVLASIATAPVIAAESGRTGSAASAQTEKGQSGATDTSRMIWPSNVKSRMVVTPASMLMGRDLTSKDGESAGTIKMLLVRVDDGEIIYALASAPGLDPVSGEFVAIPWDTIDAQDWIGWRTTGLSLNVPAKKLEEAERYTIRDVFDLISPSVQHELVEYYAPVTSGQDQQSAQSGSGADSGRTKPGKPGGQAAQSDQTHILVGQGIVASIQPPAAATASQLRGSEVVTKDGQSLGEIDEVMVDVDKGMIPYVLVARGGFLGSGEEWIAIPPQALQWQSDGARYSVDLTMKKVREMPVLKKEIVPATIRRADLKKLYSFYGVEPYWG